MLTTKQAAAHLGLTAVYLRTLLSQGKGPATAAREGEHRTAPRYFEVAELDRWQASRTRLVRAPAQPARLGPDWTWPVAR